MVRRLGDFDSEGLRRDEEVAVYLLTWNKFQSCAFADREGGVRISDGRPVKVGAGRNASVDAGSFMPGLIGSYDADVWISEDLSTGLFT